MTFWDHLEALRGCLLKILVAVAVCGVAMFCVKEPLFDLVLAPKDSNFVSYRLLEKLVGNVPAFDVELINVNLAQQFMIHLKVAMWAGVVLVSPYIIYVLFGFVAPALYENEKKYATLMVVSGYVMFMVGVLLNYLMIFPLTFRFLGTYQVSSEVVNMISLESYVGTLLMLSLVMGVVFEMPVLSWLLAKIGALKSAAMRQVRRYAIVVIMILSAIITPSGDAFTMLMVALPIYLLYEASILVVKRTEKKENKI